MVVHTCAPFFASSCELAMLAWSPYSVVGEGSRVEFVGELVNGSYYKYCAVCVVVGCRPPVTLSRTSDWSSLRWRSFGSCCCSGVGVCAVFVAVSRLMRFRP